MKAKKRYAQVGVGSRAFMYTAAIIERYGGTSELVGLCDRNEGRLGLYKRWVAARGTAVPTYLPHQFDAMIQQEKPDIVIVTTQDSSHDHYICRAMELGCDVITEKPMTTALDKCQRIIDTQQQTGKQCRVAFNYRYAPHRTQVKDLLQSRVIGDVVSVDFHWLLDTHHGADYFRRWHRRRENSGGLLVHKATHHFDLVNWWLETIPQTVFAQGQRRFYRPEQADQLGLQPRAERCLDCAVAQSCPFCLDLRQIDSLKRLYLDQEAYDGYQRDQCVFSSQIDIEDVMNVLVTYANGVQMTYSLNAFMPWEGYTIVFNGTKGRLEHKCEETVYISGDGTVPGALKKQGTTIHIYPHFAPAYAVDVWTGEGGHGGGDGPLLADIFAPEETADPYQRAAGYKAGAYSILTGIAANESMRTATAVPIQDPFQV
ncbi:MAG: Gfo/Idh/MocA family oxidoreductase [Chloroflexota bacterium]